MSAILAGPPTGQGGVLLIVQFAELQPTPWVTIKWAVVGTETEFIGMTQSGMQFSQLLSRLLLRPGKN